MFASSKSPSTRPTPPRWRRSGRSPRLQMQAPPPGFDSWARRSTPGACRRSTATTPRPWSTPGQAAGVHPEGARGQTAKNRVHLDVRVASDWKARSAWRHWRPECERLVHSVRTRVESDRPRTPVGHGHDRDATQGNEFRPRPRRGSQPRRSPHREPARELLLIGSSPVSSRGPGSPAGCRAARRRLGRERVERALLVEVDQPHPRPPASANAITEHSSPDPNPCASRLGVRPRAGRCRARPTSAPGSRSTEPGEPVLVGGDPTSGASRRREQLHDLRLDLAERLARWPRGSRPSRRRSAQPERGLAVRWPRSGPGRASRGSPASARLARSAHPTGPSGGRGRPARPGSWPAARAAAPASGGWR